MFDEALAKAVEVRNRLWRKAAAYQSVFTGPDGDRVMRDLVSFCNGLQPTTRISRVSGEVDPLASAHAEGRREVLLRIVQMRALKYDDLMRIGGESRDD